MDGVGFGWLCIYCYFFRMIWCVDFSASKHKARKVDMLM